MAKEVWKEFEDNLLTHSAAHYLMTIHGLLQERGYARVTDIARELNITRGSCSISLKPLKRRGLVLEDDNKFLHLSDEGKMLAELVERNDELLEFFFRDVLQVNDDQAEIDACKVEHLLSLETSLRLAHFVELIKAGGKSVQGFLKELHKEKPVCRHDAEKCDFCQSVCIESVTATARPARPAREDAAVTAGSTARPGRSKR